LNVATCLFDLLYDDNSSGNINTNTMPRRPKQGRVSKAARSSLIIKSSLHITRSTSPAPLRRSARFRPQTVTNKQANDNDSKDLSPTGPTFPFLKLPRELQFKIWDMVGAKPRIIMQTHEQDYRPLVTIVKPCHTPVQLHVHQASRLHYLYREDDAANAYKDHPMYRGQFRSTSKKLVFFSFEIDTLLLNDFSMYTNTNSNPNMANMNNRSA